MQSDPKWGLFEYKPSVRDSRLITTGHVIPSQYYADQPFIVPTADGAWLCVLTTGAGHEGSRGQHIIAMRSDDFGEHWSDPVAVEPADGKEASWGVPMVAKSGRIFVFYTYNDDDIRQIIAGDPPFKGGFSDRVDSLGHFAFRWSDDHGRSWQSPRVIIPVREFEIDRENSVGGKMRLFWNTGHSLISGESIFLTLHKVKGFGLGWFTQSEGAFLRSDDLLTLDDPAQATWTTLPDGEVGLQTPAGGGPISEEQSLVEMSDGSFFVVYRSVDGHPVGTYSRDQGAHWQEPDYLQYADGRYLKHPRAACFAWRLAHGDYVLWFHNHGGSVLGLHPMVCDRGYDDRNPVWMCRGWEVETPRGLELVWGNPEIVLYEDDPVIRMSYPALREEGETIYLTETQKAVARVHKVSEKLACALRFGSAAFDPEEIRGEAALDWTAGDELPVLPCHSPFLGRSTECPYGTTDLRAGFTIEFKMEGVTTESDALLAEAWHPTYGGLRLEWLAKKRGIRLVCSDGRSEFTWTSAPGFSRSLNRHVAICVDGGPKIVSFFVDGVFCDGGDDRQFGWGRFTNYFRGLPGALPVEINEDDEVKIVSLRVYPRALLFAEMEALFGFAEVESPVSLTATAS